MMPISGVMLPAEGSSHQARGSTNFAHSTQKHGDDETNNTTARPQQGTTETAITFAPTNCTKRGCQSVCVRGLIYKYAVNLSG